MASSMGCSIAEAYVMRKMHMEKMKREEEERAKQEGVDRRKDRGSSGCFSWRHQKLHATRIASEDFSSKEDDTLDQKS